MAPGEILQALLAKDRKIFWSTASITLFSLIFFTLAALPVKAKVIASTYQVAGARSVLPGFGAPIGGQPGNGQPAAFGGFFLANFRVDIEGRIKGQRIHFKDVAIFDEKGKRLGEIPISNLTRTLKSTLPAQPGQPKPPIPGASQGTSEAVQGTLFLYPLETAHLSFPAIAQKSFGIKPGQKIFAQIEGGTLFSSFSIRAPVQPVTGTNF